MRSSDNGVRGRKSGTGPNTPPLFIDLVVSISHITPCKLQASFSFLFFFCTRGTLGAPTKETSGIITFRVVFFLGLRKLHCLQPPSTAGIDDDANRNPRGFRGRRFIHREVSVRIIFISFNLLHAILSRVLIVECFVCGWW